MDLAGAKILHERGEIDAAVQAYDSLLNSDFDSVETMFYYGTALFQQGRHGLAANTLKRVIEIKPNMQSAYQNLGNCFKAALDYKAAEQIYRMGLELGEDSQLYCCMGSLNINVGSPQKALEWYAQGLAMDPGNDVIRFNMGLAYLELGDWEKGFDFYDYGFSGGARPVRHYSNLPIWTGEPDRTVIVWGEQGLGDEIMFASMIPDLMRNCKRVIFDCHPRLVDTWERAFGIECHGTRKNHHLEWLPGSDAQAHICVTSLGKWYRKTAGDFPRTPYLTAKDREGPLRTDKRLRVGISWIGGTTLTRMDLRTIPLEHLVPILKQDCDFYSLQYTPEAARDVCAFEETTGLRLKHFPNMVEVQNYDATVNFVASLDLVITIPTTVYHTAGALGVPVWCLTPWGVAWSFGQTAEDSVWYESARLFRQAKGDDWSKVIRRVADELDKRILQGA